MLKDRKIKTLKLISIIGLVFFVLSLSACASTKAEAYRVFADDIERIIGKSINEAYIYGGGFISKEVPSNKKMLQSNIEVWIYHFKQNTNNNSEPCTVYIEVNTSSNIIVNASYKGQGCWRAY